MKKTVEIEIDIEVARRMLYIAGYFNIAKMTDEEVFEKALNMNAKYGVTATIQSK